MAVMTKPITQYPTTGRNLVDMSWDPITRIVGSLGIYTKIDFANKQVAECYSTSSIFCGYSIFMKNKDPRDAHFITSRICGICGDNHATCAVYAQNMAFGVKPPPLAEWIINLGEAAEYMFDHNIYQDNLVGVDFCEQMVRETNPSVWEKAKTTPAPHAADHGYRTIADIMTALNPFSGEFYRETLQVSRYTREMFCLMEGRHVHPSTLYPGGVGTVPTIQLFTDYLVRLMRYVEFVKKVVPLHDDLFDFFYEALPGYEHVGERQVLLGCWGSFNNPDSCDYTYAKMPDWGRNMFVTPGVVDEIVKQEQRDLRRFDLDFDLPDHFLPDFPAPIFLTTRPDLGDVSQGQLVTINNFFELFNGILNPKQLEGLRLLLTPFPQQQFNHTDDRRSAEPSRGVACLDCHANGHTNAATHLAGDIRPQEFRHRIDTPTLRGVNIQLLFGSQRALKTVEDFTEFEQRAAYFDGDPVIATKKGVNILDRGSQVHFMAEFQALLDFPPAPKLDIMGKLDADLATEAELRGQELFFGKAQCASCHMPPYYTDNTMHNLKLERFYEPRMINGMMASADGPIKTFPLRGIKDSPPYLHDGRLLTLEDTVEFFNLVIELKLTEEEKADLVTFLRQL